MPAGVAPGAGSVMAFANQPLGDMVALGLVEAQRARLWIRAQRGEAFTVRYWTGGEPPVDCVVSPDPGQAQRRDNTFVATLPCGDTARLLKPCTRYRFRVTYIGDEALIGEGGFVTAPLTPKQTPARFALALMSCNLPFLDDGSISEGSTAMLRAARRCMQDKDVRFALSMGDQMYTGYPTPLSLFWQEYFRSVAPPGRDRIQDCTAAEVRALLQQRYRHFWNLDGWRALHAEFPCYPILDDHELVDNWGSNPLLQGPEWQAFGEGARAAYQDYQGARITGTGPLPEDFDYHVEYGAVAVHVLDLRSNRRVGSGARTYSERQERRLLPFLAANEQRDALFIVLSVPAIHFPAWVARLGRRLTPAGEDFSDRWSTAGHRRGRDRLLQHLHAHQLRCPRQRLVLLSGDIHIGCVHEMRWPDAARPLVQMVSSGITHHVGLPVQIGSSLSIRWIHRLGVGDGLRAKVRILPGEQGLRRNPYARLNLGLVEVRDARQGCELRFSLYGHAGDTPVCVYRSAWW